MSNTDIRKEKRKKSEKWVRLAAAIAIVLIAFGVRQGYVWAKYHAQSVQEGIAIASGVYFTANYASASTEEGEFVESIVLSGYQGTDISFDFEVRNYENNLLFNESTVVIPYSLSFWLEEATDTATYSVTYGGENKALAVGQENAASFYMHSIAGGKAASNRYTISIAVNAGQKHTAVPIYVEVRTEAGSIINSVLRGKMILNSSGGAESYIESQQFTVPNDVADEAERFAEIEKLSVLTYEIRTVGEASAGAGATEELKVSWDPSVLDIDLFDETYMEWQSRTGNSSPAVDTNGWYYITVKAMPYSAVTVNFFRGEQYVSKVVDMTTLNSYIKAEKYQESGE